MDLSVKLAAALLIACTLSAESRWTKVYRVSVAAVAAASIADTATSLGAGKGESNPLLATNGRFGARGIEIKSAIVAASVLTGWLVTRHHSRAIPAIANCGMAGVYGAIALHNSKVR